jgi:thiamine biosynthesis lipoprotein
MGTVFSIDIRDPGRWPDTVRDVVGWLHRVDSTFSTYRSDSDISRIRRGELAVADADPLVARVLDLCARVRSVTRGYFSEFFDGQVDPTGLVKGWAIERSSALLRARGSHDHAVNGGGDVQLAGEAAAGRPWRVGISDPLDRGRVVTVVAGRDFAVATSGTAERGAHIVDPVAARPATEFASVTVVGPELTFVDSYATAAFAMGADALRWVEDLPGHEAFAIRPDGSTQATSGFGLIASA